MSWSRFVLALLVSGVAILFSDWLFFGVLFHGKYKETPEVWRKIPEKKQIAWSMLIAVCAAALFFHGCRHFDVRGYHEALATALFVWLVGALPITITNTLYVKYNPVLAVSHSLGWLARLLISAVAYGWLLS